MTGSSTSDDHDLWQRVRLGDREAFDVLFTRHQAAVFGYAFRLTGDGYQAEDVVSQAFLDTWRRRASVAVEPGESLLPWLIGVAHRAAANARRSRRRWLRLQGRAPREPDAADHADAVAQRVDDESTMRWVLALLHRLPDHERQAFVLCAWGELTYIQAAEVLDIPVGTVRSRLSRARARLREILNERRVDADTAMVTSSAPPRPGPLGER
jgi:RNA polymerase sigma-70 factor (ECF subfamily)